jgi:hypothetical protein
MLVLASTACAGVRHSDVPPTSNDELACEATLEARIACRFGRRDVVIIAHGGRRPSQLVFPDRCPDGFVPFSGFPQRFDVSRTCNVGDCILGDALTVDLAPGEVRELTRVDVDRTGEGACDAPLPPGHYEVSAVAPNTRVCTIPVSFDVTGETGPTCTFVAPIKD